MNRQRLLLSKISSCWSKSRPLLQPNLVLSSANSANASDTTLNVFDRNAKRIHRNRSVFQPDFEQYEYVKSEVGFRVADRILDIKKSFDTIVDLGCQRGYVSKHLTKDTVNKVFMLEMAEKLLERAELPESDVLVDKRVFDEENNLPFENNSIDLVVSSLNLHWVNNLPKLFKEVFRCLKNDGVFIGAMFAGDTLFELRVSLQLAELERRGGLTSRISPFTTPQDVGSLMNNSGFQLLTLDFDDIQINYPSIFELMYDIKGMAENSCTWKRQMNMSKDLLISSEAIYKEMFDTEKNGSIPATYQILYFIGWKLDKLQKTAKRGSGQVSFKDIPSNANKTDENN